MTGTSGNALISLISHYICIHRHQRSFQCQYVAFINKPGRRALFFQEALKFRVHFAEIISRKMFTSAAGMTQRILRRWRGKIVTFKRKNIKPFSKMLLPKRRHTYYIEFTWTLAIMENTENVYYREQYCREGTNYRHLMLLMWGLHNTGVGMSQAG